MAEFDTACRGQLAPDEAESELFRLAIQGRALTFYKSISAACMPWIIVQSKFRSQFSSRTKKAEIGAELDFLHVSNLRDDGDTDRQALDNVIARLDKLSVMGTSDDIRTTRTFVVYMERLLMKNGHILPYASYRWIIHMRTWSQYCANLLPTCQHLTANVNVHSLHPHLNLSLPLLLRLQKT